MQNLVIVESPTKARTLSKFLGSKYQIEASMGHIRDLPKAKLGVDVKHNFEPEYIIPRDKKKKVNELKKLAKGAKQIWLATDPDREGEAIAWHIAELLNNSDVKTQKSNVKRVEFHEITEGAIKAAFEHPRPINTQLVDAQQARRVLDRLVGYKLSPLLWQKIKRGLSAGRVQSVALRLVVEREREIEGFKPIEHWSIEADLESNDRKDARFIANLIEINGEKIELKDGNGFFIHTKDEADKHLANLKNAAYKVSKVTKKEVKRYPAPPFITSTLQQAAGNKLGMSAKKTMMLAQNLYEHGFITYMRTDSFNLSSQALTAARSFIDSSFGPKYLPPQARVFRSKSKNAQEAHEAIRPTNISLQSSAISSQPGFNRDHVRLYDLIWKRTVASQMAEAVLDQTTIDVEARDTHDTSDTRGIYILRATGSLLKFDGWLKLYGVQQFVDEDIEPGKDGERKQLLPELSENEALKLNQLLPEQHFTEPPPRFSEASLIKRLEELGIGRPSTYAPILSTIQDRFYVEKQEKRFIPTPLGKSVNDFLIQYFPGIFDYAFTALMEDQLDEVSRGERKWKQAISDFYQPFEKTVEQTAETAGRVKVEVEVTDKICPECGKNLIIRTGRFGKFLACSGFPECKHTEAIAEALNIKCPKDGGDIVARRTKRGKVFYGCKNYPKCDFASWTKPK